jgi:hypothetical protein
LVSYVNSTLFMTILNRNKLKLLIIFYKSTLLLSIACGLMFFIAFGFGFLSAGSVISITYKEISKQHEYYFYYNKGISKFTLILSCVVLNLAIGLSLIIIETYA